MDNKPNGLEHGKDYVSVVSADNYGNGVEAAHVMAKAIGEQGDIGVIFHDADFFVTKQRTDAFEKNNQRELSEHQDRGARRYCRTERRRESCFRYVDEASES